jgi:serine/threonine-protein kinase
MAGDIERHLASLPILARPTSAGYRLRKLVARHRLLVGAGTVAVASLLVGLGAALWQAERARTSAETARREAARAEQTRDFLLGILRAGDPALLGGRPPAQTTLGEVIDRAEAQIDRQPQQDADLRKNLLTTLASIHSSLDQTDRSTALLEQALAFSRQVDGVPHAYQAQVLSALASGLLFGNRHAQAAARNAELGALLEQLGDDRSIAYARHVRLKAMLLAAKDSSHHAEVRELLQRAAVVFRTAGPTDPGRVGTLYGLARVHAALGDIASSLVAADEAVQAAEVSDRPQMERPNARSLRGMTRARAGQLGAALEDLRAADAGYRSARGARHFLTLQNQGLLGELLHATGQQDEGLRLMQTSLDAIKEVRPGTSTHGYALDRLGAAYVSEGRPALALSLLEEAERLWAARGLDFARGALETHAEALERLGRFEDAAAKIDALRALNVARDGGKPDSATLLREGLLAGARGQGEAARRALEKCEAITNAPTRAERWRHAQALDGLARLDLQEGRADAARDRVERLAAVALEAPLREDPRARQLSDAAAAACAEQGACRSR